MLKEDFLTPLFHKITLRVGFDAGFRVETDAPPSRLVGASKIRGRPHIT